ncbi:MAG: class A beta-lactamase-related serine hydrolase [Alphaproteobacteria bacterium]|nr:class A beta-lactamase-related serine hydrolase [Alphaproteobacteria bacterium]
MDVNLPLCPFIRSVLGIVFMTGSLLAQTQSSGYSGSWIVDVGRTGIPGLPAYCLSISHHGDTLVYLTSVPQPSGDSLKTMKKMIPDGREGSYTDQKGNPVPCSARYIGDTLALRFSHQQFRKGKKVLLTIEEKHWLSADGNTLMIMHAEGSEGRMGFYPKPIILSRMYAETGVKAGIPFINLESCNPSYPAPVLTETSNGQVDPEVDSLLRRMVLTGGVPSISVAFLENGEIRWVKNINGVAGLNTAYRIGSISKPFTATTILRLAESGKLSLDDDVSRYLPFPLRNPLAPETPITLRMLLTHQSGLAKETPEFDRLFLFSDKQLLSFSDSIGFPLPGFNETPDRIDFFRELVTPGGKHYTEDVWAEPPLNLRYSNIGFTLLTLVVEQVSGIPFGEFVTREIFVPLGMDHSGFRKDDHPAIQAIPTERIAGESFSFMEQEVPLTEDMKKRRSDNRLDFPLYDQPPGASGLWASAEDISRFLAFHMLHGTGINGYQVLKKETLSMMHEAAARGSGGAIDIFPVEGQGMGWTVCSDGISGHIGGQLGYTSAMIMKQSGDETAGFIILMNHACRLVTDRECMRQWFQHYYAGLEKILLKRISTSVLN